VAKRALGPYESEKVRLRLLEETDLPRTLAWRNQDHIRKWFFNSDVIDEDRHRAWFAKYSERDDDFVFVIESRADAGMPVGQVSLYHIDWEGRTAEYGRLMIGEPSARGRGLAHAATDRLLEAAFVEIELREVYLEVVATNEPAIAIYRACGFVAESPSGGTIRMRLAAGKRGRDAPE
jgi:diamine N-acetyltransferase